MVCRVVTKPALGFGVSRLVGGVAFSLGLIPVVVGGAELFTGNHLVAMAWASRRITSAEGCRNWLLVYAGNAVGAFGTEALVLLGHLEPFGDGTVRDTALTIGCHKAALGVGEAVALGMLCTTLLADSWLYSLVSMRE
ncbi:MAG TPA: formate/nitrite transporter family protein [Candidatus Tectomicrobia bacterium]|jgi:formate/nitrite transporter FocA (FNT family)